MALNNTNPNPMDVINNRNELFRFIQPLDVKTYCNLAANIEDSQIIPNIVLSQDTKIESVLGATLYKELVDEFTAVNFNANNLPTSGTTIPTATTNYFELYKAIYKPLIWWSYYNSLPIIAIKVEEKGIMLNDSDYSENGGIVGLKEVETRARKMAEHYQEILICYISTTFKARQVVENESKQEGARFGGIFFPSKRRRHNCNKCK